MSGTGIPFPKELNMPMTGLMVLWMNSGLFGKRKKSMATKTLDMGSRTTSNLRDFQSYLDEYLLQTTEAEINAFWKRMDEVVKKMPLEQKKQFFQDLISGIDESVEDSISLRQQLSSLA
ncbi:MAG: hypothetical protein HY842_04780 [Bacteroidetes bacterium]|nr:hypothetical protein [Bacteroidota bacterium]